MRLAILEDDTAFGGYVAQLMGEAGHQATEFRDPRALVRALRLDSYDLLLLDCVPPTSSGFDVLNWIKQNLDPAPPTIMISALAGDRDIVAGLSRGADDYVTKPLHGEILKARVGSLLRRVYGDRSDEKVECFGDHAFDLRYRTVTVKGQPVATNAKEFALALFLFRNLNRPLSRAHLMESVWGHAPDSMSRTLDSHISLIRNRLGLRPENGLRLSAVYNFGYRLEEIQ